MKTRRLWAFFGLVAALSCSAQTEYLIRFDRDVYQITPGETFQVTVLFEPASLSGLFSYAVQVSMEDFKAKVSDVNGISVPMALSHNGVLGPGALKAIGLGTAGVKGTVDFFASPLEYYFGTELATLDLTDLSATPGQYRLTLSGYNTLGPTETLFVDGDGNPLDSFITYGEATVSVIPEPSVAVLVLLGVSLIFLLNCLLRTDTQVPSAMRTRSTWAGEDR